MDNEFENVEVDEAEIGLIEAGIEILSDITHWRDYWSCECRRGKRLEDLRAAPAGKC